MLGQSSESGFANVSDNLVERVAVGLASPVLAQVRAFAERLALGQLPDLPAPAPQSEGKEALAVLFYGSNLRTGSLDGVLDFYVLTQGAVERGIWPRVSYHEWQHEGQTLRAKVATMTLATFREAAAGNLLDTTIWARFVQPSALAWCRDTCAADAVAEAVAGAARTAGRLAVALGPETGTPQDYWRCLFRATYAAEFRVEKPGREDSILAVNRAHFDGLLRLALIDAGIGVARGAQDTIRPLLGSPERRVIARLVGTPPPDWQSLQRRAAGARFGHVSGCGPLCRLENRTPYRHRCENDAVARTPSPACRAGRALAGVARPAPRVIQVRYS